MNNYSLKDKTINQLLLFIFLFAAASFLTENHILLFGYVVLIFIISALNIQVGFFAWIIIAPIANAIEIDYILYIFTASFSIPFIFKLLSGKESVRKNILNKHIVFTIFLIMFSSTLFYLDYVHLIFIYLLVFISTIAVFQQATKNKLGMTLIINGFILSAIIATFYAFMIKGEDIERLGIGENIRSLANINNFSLVFIFYFYVFKNNQQILKKDLTFKLINRFKWFIIVFQAVGLFATVSRGAIISFVITIALMFIIYVLSNIRMLYSKKILKSIIIPVLLVMLTLWYSDEILKMFDVSSGYIEARFAEEHMESGSSVRTQLWLNTIAELSGVQIIIGHGISSFNYLAEKVGYSGLYSHSVYADTIVTTGVLGFLSLLTVFIVIVYYSIKLKQISLLTLLLFLTLNYSTHGAMTSSTFWYFLAALSAIVYQIRSFPDEKFA